MVADIARVARIAPHASGDDDAVLRGDRVEQITIAPRGGVETGDVAGGDAGLGLAGEISGTLPDQVLRGFREHGGVETGDFGLEGAQAGVTLERRARPVDPGPSQLQVPFHGPGPLAEPVEIRARKVFPGGLPGDGAEGLLDRGQPDPGGRQAGRELIGFGGGKVGRRALRQQGLELCEFGGPRRADAGQFPPEALHVAREGSLGHHPGARNAPPDEGRARRGRQQNAAGDQSAADVEKRQAPSDAARGRGEGVAPGEVVVECFLDRLAVHEVAQLLVHALDVADRGLAVEGLVLLERLPPPVDDLGGIHHAQHFVGSQRCPAFARHSVHLSP